MQCSFSTAEAVLEAYYISSCDYLADVSSCHTISQTQRQCSIYLFTGALMSLLITIISFSGVS
eukprot:8866-Heterococcus_DN1.PRE.1